MKASRRLIVSLALLLSAVVSFPALATEYPGGALVWNDYGTFTTTVNVPAAGTVTDVSVIIRNAQTQLGFDWNTMLLTSPAGTTIAFFDVSLNKISGTSLYLTRFIDTAPIIITDGVSPYAGSFRPGESFSDFNGELMTGSWTLAVYNHRAGTANQGAVTDWSLIINQATPVPTLTPAVPTPTPVLVDYREYHGNWFSWTGVSTTSSIISIGNQGFITDVNVKMNVSCSASLDPLGMYLISPLGSIVSLFNKHDLEETTMYLTTFDDQADRSILTGIAPYIGLYRPVASLALLNNQTVTGDWTLVAFNDDVGNNGTVTAWSLIIGIKDFVTSPTPTLSPTPTVTTTPSPIPTATPVGYCQIYPGQEFTVEERSVHTEIISINNPKRVDKVVVNIENFSALIDQGLDLVGMYLISPQETVVALFEKHMLEEHAIAGTWFDDSAPADIRDGIAPYVGRFRPTGELSEFAGEPIQGEWKLLVFNDGVLASCYMNEWALQICEAAPTPSPPPVTPTPTVTPIVFCRDYSGSPISWSGVTSAVSEIFVGHSGDVAKAEVTLSVNCAVSLEQLGVYLISPDEDYIGLFEVGYLDGHVMYKTVFDDSATEQITQGIAPYVGKYRPIESLNWVNGDPAAGTWGLLVYNSGTGNMGEVSDWELRLCLINSAPTPTSTPLPTQTPAPPRTPTPAGYKTPSPTPVGYHTPPPTPNACFEVIPPDPPIYFVGVGITEAEVYVPYNVPIEDVDVEVSAWVNNPEASSCGTLDFKALYITAPNNVIVKLFGKHDLEEQGLYLTYFDDEAEISVLNDIAPYYGPHQPVGLLDKFRQEGTWTRGTWTLSWYNDCSEDLGFIEHFSLCLNRPDLTPSPTATPRPTAIYTPTLTPAGYKTPVPTVTPIEVVCENFSGSFIEWSDVEVAIGTVTIGEIGLIEEVWLNIDELYCATSLDHIGMYLISPGGEDATIVQMFEKHQLEEHQLYLTTFRNDATRTITSGIAPYIGSFRPTGNLGNLSGVQINGDWQLVVYNDADSNDGYVTGWDLKICYASGAMRTPTPPPTPLTSPTPLSAGILVLESGDYDGDGTSDIGIFRPSLGRWSVLGVGTSFFGEAGDVPASGDYDGDGTADISVFRPSSGLWAVYGVTRTYYGKSGDTSIPGDYTGDGLADIGIFRGASGLWAVRGRPRIYFGASGDIPVPGDYTGDGSADYAVFRNSSGLWAIRGTTRFYFGVTGDIPLGRDFFGDGTALAGIFRPATGLWVIRGLTRFYFGGTGDYPVGADFSGDWTDYPGLFRPASGLWAIRGVTRAYHGQPGDLPVAR